MNIGQDTLYCPPLHLVWASRPGDSTPAGVVHKTYAREVWRERTARGKIQVALRYSLWPFVVFGAIGYFTACNGAAIKRRSGRGISLQVLDQFRLAAKYGILPPWYYMFELFHEANRRRAGDYLHRYETKNGVYSLMRVYVEKASGRALSDKKLFAGICAQHKLPTPAIIGTIEGGVFHPSAPRARADGRFALPRADLFVKPRTGKGGKDTLRAIYSGKGKYRLSDGTVHSARSLIDHLQVLGQDRDHIVQRRLVNHPDLRDLCAGALSCVRIMTCRNEEGGFEVTNAAFRMAQSDASTVDGLHMGGVVARVDIETGELGPATDLGFFARAGWMDNAPFSGARIKGRVLPMWGGVRELALRAHAVFAHKVTVGWDIAITRDGPVVVEGNGSPCVDIIQRVDEPMGATRFGELLAYHLKCAINTRAAIAGAETDQARGVRAGNSVEDTLIKGSR